MMWVAIVGSRTLGQCNCAGRTRPFDNDRWVGQPHPEDCPMVVEYMRMMHIVSRWASKDGFEGIVTGGAKGADTLAENVARGFNLRVMVYKPEGRGSFAERASRRNAKIVRKADALVAVYGPGPKSPGTTDTVEKAIAAGKPVYILHEGEWSTA